MKKTLLLFPAMAIIGSLVATLSLSGSAAADTVIYSNDGSTNLAFNGAVSVADPFGTGMGDILAVENDFGGGGSFINVNTGLIDVAGLEGREWTLTYNIYSHIDIDDNAYSSVQNDFQGSGNATAGSTFYGLNGQATWETFGQTGTFADPVTNTSSRILFVSNTQGTSLADEGQTGPRYYLDNITLTVSAIPEPSSLTVLGLLGGLLGLRRRK